jgi:hypothetical protein
METTLHLIHIEDDLYKLKELGVNVLLIDGKIHSTANGQTPIEQVDLPYEIVQK